jgi:hypothetical protein
MKALDRWILRWIVRSNRRVVGEEEADNSAGPVKAFMSIFVTSQHFCDESFKSIFVTSQLQRGCYLAFL